MQPEIINSPGLKYVADCHHVREVSLWGTADLDYWTRHLAGQGLIPAESDGKARILTIAGNMRYMGVAFTEVSFSILLNHPGQSAGHQVTLLAQAFNSSRVFAFC